MKVALILALAALLAVPALADYINGTYNNTPSADPAVNLGMMTYLDFLNKTTGDDCRCGCHRGCCPSIVVGPYGSVIQPFTGYRGNVAIIVDWGHDDPWFPWRRRCTVNDRGFIYYVNWGDGSHDSKYRDVLGPFQVAHQYPKYRHSYGVTVVYCSDPDPSDPGRRCCDSLYRVIDVSYDPQHPFPAEMFAEKEAL